MISISDFGSEETKQKNNSENLSRYKNLRNTLFVATFEPFWNNF
jgi:hypothetical protein